ncbi:MAG: hypothetical protein F6J93_19290 [Oscillatoria sp. SIO1A7]|nr:hypothetical protein [Oscillatoria sp. SIO1A7]
MNQINSSQNQPTVQGLYEVGIGTRDPIPMVQYCYWPQKIKLRSLQRIASTLCHLLVV